MKKVLVSVEGQTEETFVTEVLQPHFTDVGLFLIPILVKTRRVPGRSAHRGGYLAYPKVKRELLSLLGDTSAAAVTTMYDFYKLPDSFPGHASLPQGNGLRRVQHLELHLQEDIEDPRFRPYLQLHEFEALLFVDIQKTTEWLLGDNQQLGKLRRIGQAFPNPEEIDEGEQTAPSKRLKGIFPIYEKAADGPLIVMEIGLPPLRETCSHFDAWITWLEQVASET